MTGDAVTGGAVTGDAVTGSILQIMVHLGFSCVTCLFFQENERTKDLIIEQRFHRAIIGQKGENIKEVRDKFPEVSLSFRRNKPCDLFS